MEHSAQSQNKHLLSLSHSSHLKLISGCLLKWVFPSSSLASFCHSVFLLCLILIIVLNLLSPSCSLDLPPFLSVSVFLSICFDLSLLLTDNILLIFSQHLSFHLTLVLLCSPQTILSLSHLSSILWSPALSPALFHFHPTTMPSPSLFFGFCYSFSSPFISAVLSSLSLSAISLNYFLIFL